VLLTHPDQLDEIRRDPELLPGAIEELLRYVSMLFILVRTAKEDTEVAGQPVCAGDGLIVGPALANKDPRAFPDPDRFDIHRDNRHHVAFGFGPHQCLGQPVARLELGIVLETLLRRIPTLRLAVHPGDVPFKATNLVGVASLPVTW
jgi:cytochrome P450